MFDRRLVVVPILVALGAVVGCTQLEVRRYDGAIVEGIPYALPQRSLLISVEYQLLDCSVENKILSFKVQPSATVVPITEAGERFYVPYSSIRNPFKDSEVTIESYDNGTLKTISATVTDKTGPAITAAVGSALRVIALTSASPAPALAGAEDDKSLRKKYCNGDAIAALDEIASLKAQAKAPAASPATAPKKQKAKEPAGAAKVGPAASAADPVEADANVDKIAAAIDKLKAKLSIKEAEKWTPRKDAKNIGTRLVDHRTYPRTLLKSEAWLTANGLQVLLEAGKARKDKTVVVVDGEEQFQPLITQLTLELDRAVIADPELPSVLGGFLVRNSGLALMRVCDGLCPDDTRDVTGVVGATDQVVPQLGEYVVLPLKNRLFEKQTLNVTMSADGVLQKVGVTTSATAASALENLNSNLDAIKAAKDASDKAKADARTAAANQTSDAAKKVTEANKAVAECLAAQKSVVDAGGKSTGTCQP